MAVGTRVSVFSAFLVAVLGYYLGLLYAALRRQEAGLEMRRMGGYLFLYGTGVIISSNFLIGGLFQAVWAWVVLACLLAWQGCVLFQVGGSRQEVAQLLYILSGTVWLLGATIDMFINL
jgi:hypothetical protein